MRADPQIGDEPDSGCKPVLDLTPAAEPLSLEEPILAAMEVGALAAAEPVTAPSNPPDSLPHGTRLFYELLSCGEPCGRMGRGGWPAMRSRHQWMASSCAASRIFLRRSKPTRKID